MMAWFWFILKGIAVLAVINMVVVFFWQGVPRDDEDLF